MSDSPSKQQQNSRIKLIKTADLETTKHTLYIYKMLREIRENIDSTMKERLITQI